MIRACFFAVTVVAASATSALAQQYSAASGALMRGLDKVSGETQDLEITAGGTAVFGDLRIGLGECRYPAQNPAGEAFAFVTMAKISTQQQVFGGWMLSSAPALNALDHPRYDVWVLRCKTPVAE